MDKLKLFRDALKQNEIEMLNCSDMKRLSELLIHRLMLKDCIIECLDQDLETILNKLEVRNEAA